MHPATGTLHDGDGEDPSSSGTDWPRRTAVVGPGYMGTGFVQLLALAGLPVAIGDVSQEAAEAARSRAIEGAGAFALAGMMPSDAADRVARHTVAAASIGDASTGADVIFEAVPESPALKASVLASIEAAAPTGALIATNTSAIPIAELSAPLTHPDRFLGAHWFNPSQWVPCVELIAGPSTDPAHLETMAALLERLGKRPSVVGDGPGFVANRIQFAMFKEAATIVEEGVATAEVIDEVVRASFGFRLPFFGPFTIADMAGLDVYAGAYGSLEAGLGSRMAVPEAVATRVAEGRLGMKTGGGFLELDGADAAAMASWRDEAYVAMERLLGDLGPWDAKSTSAASPPPSDAEPAPGAALIPDQTDRPR
ncbi:MAG: 3-hydroxyacyl-CoA dehydrogenase family protein [Solirubrobacteraceae bacterium]|nr:3-hydroxyacyl-CoA dehydrogenase family protein [Solirubrobacteraceae bacterium]